jgi:predicted ATPase
VSGGGFLGQHVAETSRGHYGQTMGLLGRGTEFRVLCDMLSSAQNSRGDASVVCGEAGIGKSHLLGAVANEARRRDFRVLEVRGHASRSALPFDAAVSLLDLLLVGSVTGVTPYAGTSPAVLSEDPVHVLEIRAHAPSLQQQSPLGFVSPTHAPELRFTALDGAGRDQKMVPPHKSDVTSV